MFEAWADRREMPYGLLVFGCSWKRTFMMNKYDDWMNHKSMLSTGCKTCRQRNASDCRYIGLYGQA